MNGLPESLLTGLGVALGCGLLIGVERERRKGDGDHRAAAGLRTFTLAALAGALAQGLGQPWLVMLGGLLVATLVAIGYWKDRSKDPGITTELALFLTYILGVTAVEHARIAAGAAVIVAGLLMARTHLHRFSTNVLSAEELRSLLILAASALVVLPLLPDRPMAWMAGVNPRDLWRLTVTLMALQAVGYVGLRFTGPSAGMLLSGLISGFVSSTATTATMAQRARQEPALATSCLTGALASNLSTVVQLLVVAASISPSLVPALLPMMGAGGLVIAVICAVLWFRLRQGLATTSSPHAMKVLSFQQALLFAALLSGLATGVGWLARHGPAESPLVAVFLAAFADVHASAAAAFALHAAEGLSQAQTLTTVLLALTANSCSKVIAGFAGGGPRFGIRLGAGLLAMLAGAWWAHLATTA